MMEYRREIDGLRAIAVLPVILFHAGFSWFSGGYIGVDVFFVISGYLITSILIKDLERGSFSILQFYERRARRILPALFFVMICCIPFAYLWMLPQQYKDFSQALVAISFFGSNILFWRKSGYFSPAAEENPLLHTWSLAVEEQFYIFFPIMLLLLWRFGRNPIFYIVILLSALSFLLAEWGWRNSPTANFYLLPTRAWELGAGAICALILSGRKPTSSSTLSLLGLVMILYSIVFFDETTPFPSIYTLVPVIGTSLIILFAGNGSQGEKILSNKFLVGIGLVSFSAYLWHQPLLAFARIRSPFEPSWFLMLALSILSVILAIFSWRFIEQPFRSKEGSLAKTRGQIFSYSAAGTVLFISLGIYGHVGAGLPNREAPSGIVFSELDIGEKLKVNHGLSSKCEGEFTTSPECRTGDSPEIMVWGDSYAMHLVQAVQSSGSLQDKQIIQFTKSVCSPISNLALTNQRYTQSWSSGCIDFNRSVMEWLKENDTVEYVVMSSPMGIIHNSTYDSSGELRLQSKDLVTQKLNETARFVKELGKKPVFISPPPRSGSDLSRCATYNQIFSNGEPIDCSLRVEELSPGHVDVIEFLNSEELELPVVMLSDFMCDGMKCETFVDGVHIFRDRGHLSHAGSQLLGRNSDLVGAIMEAASR